MSASDTLDANRRPELVAPDLLGWTLVCRGAAAVLVEVEAYHQDEPACHAFGGRPTPRTEGLFGPAGTLYIYFTYGMHWCANLVTGEEGSGEAVLFRAGIPVAGEELMRVRRAAKRGVEPVSLHERELCNGPAKLVEALDLRPEDGGVQLLVDSDLESALAFDAGPRLVYDVAAAASAGVDLPLAPAQIAIGPRIGITKAVELPWRFGIAGSQYLSKRF